MGSVVYCETTGCGRLADETGSQCPQCYTAWEKGFSDGYDEGYDDGSEGGCTECGL